MSDVLTDYVAVLDRRLRGPRRLRGDMLAEAADGLADAAEAYERTGLTPQEARERAIADFGAPAEIAPEYQAELTADQARRSVLLVAAALPGLKLAWDMLWLVTTPGSGATPGEAMLAWLRAADWYGLLVALPAIALVVLLGRPYRRSRSPRRLVLGAGWFALVAAGVNVAVWLTISAMAPEKMVRMVVDSPSTGVMLALSAVVMGLVVASARSCLALAFSDRGTAGSRARSPR
jgi:hypothetical protein